MKTFYMAYGYDDGDMRDYGERTAIRQHEPPLYCKHVINDKDTKWKGAEQCAETVRKGRLY